MKKTVLLLSFCASAVGLQAQSLLHNNGSFISDPGLGAGGAHVSAIQTGLTNYGFNHRRASNFRVAEDFTVPTGQTWTVDSLIFYAYQTGSPVTTTMNNLNYRIWNGVPGSAGATVVYGDTAVNRLATSTFTTIFRTTGTAFTNSDRPIMRNAASAPALTLTAGTYWLDWQTGGSLASGPWAPPIVIPGQTTTGNAMQLGGAGTWGPILDGPNSTSLTIPQGLPFVIKGTSAGAVNDASISSITSPGNGCPTSSAQICAVIKNLGSASLSNIPVRYTINGGTPVNEVFAGPLAAGDSATYCFTAGANFGTAGDRIVAVSTQLTADELMANNTATKTITVFANPNVTLTNLPATLCISAPAINLNGAPANGTYAGPGITGNVFSAAAAGLGSHTVTYTFTNTAGCTNTVTRTVNVGAAPTSAFTHTNSGATYTFTSTSTGATTYSWNFGDGGTSTAANPTYTYASAGNFTVTLVATGGGCSVTSTQQVSVIVGLSEELEKAIMLYPNPSAGNFVITLPSAENTSVEVLSLLGQVMQLSVNQYGKEIQVNMKDCAKGVYLVKFNYQNHTVLRKLVIE